MHNGLRTYYILLFLFILTMPAGCGEDFAPYNEVTGFRVLAVETQPSWAVSGQPVALDALVHLPSESTEAPSYQWSWCPLPIEGTTETLCAISHADFQALVAEVDPTFSVPDYMLSSGELPYPIPQDAVTDVCLALEERALPTLLERPDCESGLTVAVAVKAQHEGVVIHAFKRIFIPAGMDEAPNTSPTLLALSVIENEQPQPLEEAPITRLKANTEYTLNVTIPRESSETYTQLGSNEVLDETLSLTWFVEGGETDFERTGYIPDEDTLDKAGTNVWLTPDRPGSQMNLTVVIRDDRLGVGWLRRRVMLE